MINDLSTQNIGDQPTSCCFAVVTQFIHLLLFVIFFIALYVFVVVILLLFQVKGFNCSIV